MKGLDFMKEKIYTIPITEIFEEECFCPFCKLFKRLSEEEIKYAIGPAMMEPDYRAKTNELGFCREHIKELNSYPKALALSLVIDTHLDRISNVFDTEFKKEKKSLFKKSDFKEDIENYLEELNSFDSTCVICEKVNYTFLRYLDTFCFMIDKDKDFLSKVLESDGFCIPHYTAILNALKRNVSSTKFIELAEKLNALEKKKFSKYKSDVEAFIKSFDYHNAGKPLSVPSDTVLKSSYLLNGEFEKLNKKLDDI